MGETLIKITQGEDLYATWDSGTEAPTFLGTRTEVLEVYGDVQGRCPTCRSYIGHHATTRERLNRADQHGSSSHIGKWRWNNNTGIYAQSGILHRHDIPAVVTLLSIGAEIDDPRILALLTPLERN